MKRALLFVSILVLLFFLTNNGAAQGNQIVNNGDATSAAVFPGTGCIYNWVNDQPSIGLPASGTGNIAPFIAVNAGSTAIKATITATPVLSGNAYVAGSGSPGIISVINMQTNMVVTAIQVGNVPIGVSSSPDGSRVYVANSFSNNVSVINTATNTVIATIPVDSDPNAVLVSPDGSLVYVGNINTGTVSVITTASNSVTATIKGFFQPHGLAISPDGGVLYVCNSASNTVSLINTATNALISKIKVGFDPWELFITPDGNQLYVTNLADNTVSVINTVSGSVVATIPVGSVPEGVTVSPDGRFAYIGNFGSGSVSVIDTKTNIVVNTLSVSAPIGISMSADSKTLCVVNNDASTVTIINTATNAIVAVLHVGTYPNSYGNFIAGGTGCTPEQFTVTVNAATPPTITAGIATGTISACAGSASASPDIQQFTVSGNNLTNDIAVTAPGNFEVSLNPSGGYSGSLTLTQSGGLVNSTTVYVRSAASASAGNIPGNILLSSTGASSQAVKVNGVINPLPTVNTVPGQVVIKGAPATAVHFTGTGNVFNWVNDTPGIGLPASGSGDIASFTAINNTGNTIVATITVTPFFAPFLYISNYGSNSLDVINTATNSTVTSIPLGSASTPLGVSVSPDGSRVYVANNGLNTVSVINTASNTVIANIHVGSSPFGVAISPDGNRVYVANNLSDDISVINTLTNAVIATIPIGANPWDLAVSPDGSSVYVTDYQSAEITAISTSTNTVSATIATLTNPFGLIFSPDGSRVYVANSGSNVVSVINTATNTVSAIIPVGSDPYEIAISPDGGRAYVTNYLSNNVSVINTASNAVISTFPVGQFPYGVFISPDGDWLYVVNAGSNNISVINVATGAVKTTIPIYPTSYTVGNSFAKNTGCSGAPVTFTITVKANAAVINAGAASGSISACDGTASASPDVQQFTASASGLASDITVTAPADFEVSLNPSDGYSASLILKQAGGRVNNTVIYVRSAATAAASRITGNVTLSSTGTGITVAVWGIVNARPVVNTVSDKIVDNGMPVSAINFTGTGSGFSWTNDTPGIGLAASGTGDIAAFRAINTGTSVIKATVTVMALPVGLAYVSNDKSNSVSVINTNDNQVVATIPVGLNPHAVAGNPDGSLMYVGLRGANAVSVIDTRTNTVVKTIKAGNGPLGLAVSPDGGKLYVTYGSDDAIISIINTATGNVTNIPCGVYNYGLCVSPDGRLLYVANYIANTISVYNTASNTLRTTIPCDNGTYGVAVSPDGSRLYVTNAISNDVIVINTAANTVTDRIRVGSNPNGIVISPDGSTVYTTNLNANSVSVISTATDKVIATVNTGSLPYGISISPNGKVVYVANNGSDDVSVINTATNTVTATFPVGQAPEAFGNFITNGTGCSGTPSSFTITVNPSPQPSIAAAGALSPLNTIYGTPSTIFSISGTALNGGILVTPPPGFEVSTNDVNFAGSVTVGAAGDVASTQVYIRLAATTHVGSYSKKIALTSTGAQEVNIDMPLSTVTPAPLTIKADDKKRPFETPNPPLTATYTGFKNNDTPADLTTPPELSTIAALTSPIGEYPITISGAVSTDYTITPVPGVLTIVGKVVIPNTFTPNGDGINDTWDIKYLNSYLNCTVQIYNRYGENVYSSIGYGIPWNGTYKGARLPAGAYYYIINLKNGVNALSGFVAIIR